jgi:hypothetical protein
MPVDLVTIHHEGGGAPSDDVGRFAHGGYCYGIGVSLYERFRAPADGWATMNFNGEDLTICLSGNRMTAPVTDRDLDLIRGAFLDCYNRGEVTAAPLVRAHRDSPGSATACPGDKTMERWSAVSSACRADGAPPPVGGDDVPGMKDCVDALATSEGAWRLQYDGGVETIRGPFTAHISRCRRRSGTIPAGVSRRLLRRSMAARADTRSIPSAARLTRSRRRDARGSTARARRRVGTARLCRRRGDTSAAVAATLRPDRPDRGTHGTRPARGARRAYRTATDAAGMTRSARDLRGICRRIGARSPLPSRHMSEVLFDPRAARDTRRDTPAGALVRGGLPATRADAPPATENRRMS